MPGIDYANEKFLGIPIPEDGVSFGTVSASGITPYLKINNTIVSGSYGYQTVTITLKGIGEPPLQPVTAANLGTQTFTYRGKTWVVTNTTAGARFSIGAISRLYTWSCTGVDTSTPILSV